MDISPSRFPGFMALHNLNTNSQGERNKAYMQSTANLDVAARDVAAWGAAVDGVVMEAKAGAMAMATLSMGLT